MSKAVLLAIYGDGGHRAEMTALIQALQQRSNHFSLVTLGDGMLSLPVLEHVQCADIRSKHRRVRNLLMTLPLMLVLAFKVWQLSRRYAFVGAISTGPGLAVTPMLVCRLLGIKTVFIETYSRFHSRSMTGRILSRIAQRFLVQNQSLQALYPNAEYCGRL